MKGIQEKIAPIADLEVHQRIGKLDGSGLRFGLVVARFNDQLTDAVSYTHLTLPTIYSV